MSDQRPTRTRLDPAVDMMRRIERLERSDAHPDSVLGLTTDDVGNVEPTEADRHGTGWAGVVEVIRARLAADEDVLLDTGGVT